MKRGDTFRQTFVITDKVYQGFLEVFADRNPLHTDHIFAQAKGFSSEVMHGNILCGFLSAFIGEGLPVKEVIIHWQEIKFMKPSYLNDMLSLVAEVVEVHDSVQAVEFKYYFEKIDSVKVARGRFQIGII